MSESRKVKLLGAAFAALLFAAAALILFPAWGSDPREIFVLGVVDDFNARNEKAFLQAFATPLVVSINGRENRYQRDELRAELRSLYQRLSYVNIRPESADTGPYGISNTTRVEFDFHWTAANNMYPGNRMTSKRTNPDGKPDRAVFALGERGEVWLIERVDLSIASR